MNYFYFLITEYVEPTLPPTTTTAVTTKHKKYNHRPDKNRHYNKQNNLDTEEDSLEYVDDVDYRKALSQNPRTQVSGINLELLQRATVLYLE